MADHPQTLLLMPAIIVSLDGYEPGLAPVILAEVAQWDMELVSLTIGIMNTMNNCEVN